MKAVQHSCVCGPLSSARSRCAVMPRVAHVHRPRAATERPRGGRPPEQSASAEVARRRRPADWLSEPVGTKPGQAGSCCSRARGCCEGEAHSSDRSCLTACSGLETERHRRNAQDQSLCRSTHPWTRVIHVGDEAEPDREADSYHERQRACGREPTVRKLPCGSRAECGVCGRPRLHPPLVHHPTAESRTTA